MVVIEVLQASDRSDGCPYTFPVTLNRPIYSGSSARNLFCFEWSEHKLSLGRLLQGVGYLKLIFRNLRMNQSMNLKKNRLMMSGSTGRL